MVVYICMPERNKTGRPVNAKAVKETLKLKEAVQDSLTYREKALIIAKKLGKQKVDPKSVHRWEQYTLEDVA